MHKFYDTHPTEEPSSSQGIKLLLKTLLVNCIRIKNVQERIFIVWGKKCLGTCNPALHVEMKFESSA